MRIVLCDDHEMFVEALASVLSGRGWTVCATTFTATEGEAAIRRHRPDIGLLDFTFPDGNAIGAIRALASSDVPTRLILLTANYHTALAKSALDLGVRGLLSKTQRMEKIIEVMERVGLGETVVDGTPAREVDSPTLRASERVLRDLTTRECEVLRRIALGDSTAALAAGLGVSVHTARTHIRNILKKLGVHSRLEAAALAVRVGLISEESFR